MRLIKFAPLTAVLILAVPAESATFWPAKSAPLARRELSGFRIVTVPGIREKFIAIEDQLFPQSRALLTGFSGVPWTNGKLIYTYAANVTAAQKATFEDACKEWGKHAKVSCVAKTNQTVYVTVRTANVNNATVGMPATTGVINIKNWDRKFKVAHEIGHSLGLAHEHCRSDRDTYVEILTDNILPGEEHNFDKHNTDNEGTAYDFESVMHYGSLDFGKTDQATGKTLMTIKMRKDYAQYQNVIGQRSKLSTIDAGGMKARYGAP